MSLREVPTFESAHGNLREAIELYLETWGAPKALESL
jgi:predicted RNase H-like HicB family nuclease